MENIEVTVGVPVSCVESEGNRMLVRIHFSKLAERYLEALSSPQAINLMVKDIQAERIYKSSACWVQFSISPPAGLDPAQRKEYALMKATELLLKTCP